jgi:hypothetical protein
MSEELIELTPHDAWVLSFLARVPRSKRDIATDLIEQLSSEEIKEIGKVLTNETTSANPRINEVVSALQDWKDRNRMPTRKEVLRKRLRIFK